MSGAKLEWALGSLAALALAQAGSGQGSVPVQLPPGVNVLIETEVLVVDDAGYLNGHESPLYSFSLTSGVLLDPDGVDMPAHVSAHALFPGDLLACATNGPVLPTITVVDISHPEALSVVGSIPLPGGGGFGGPVICAAPDGRTGFVCVSSSQLVQSFDIQTLSVLDSGGLVLPGDPGRSALVGDRLVVLESGFGGRVFLVDVSDPTALALAGEIAIPGAYFGSPNEVEVGPDGRTAFVQSSWGGLYSIDVPSGTLADPDGLPIPTGSGGRIDRHGDMLACGASSVVYFVDVSDPTDLRIVSQSGVIAPSSAAAPIATTLGTAFSRDGSLYAVTDITPPATVLVLDVQTGDLVGPSFEVGNHPTYTATFGPDDRVIVASYDSDTVELVHGLLAPAQPRVWCLAKTSSQGCTPQLVIEGLPSASAVEPCRLTASEVINQKPGLLVYGLAPAFDPFQGGWHCVAWPQSSTGSQSSAGNAPPDDCSGRLSFDFNRLIRSGLDPQLVPGAVVYAQFWYRDPLAAPSAGLTSAAQLVIAP